MKVLKQVLKNVIMEKIIWICLINFKGSYICLHGDSIRDIGDMGKKYVKKN